MTEVEQLNAIRVLVATWYRLGADSTLGDADDLILRIEMVLAK